MSKKRYTKSKKPKQVHMKRKTKTKNVGKSNSTNGRKNESSKPNGESPPPDKITVEKMVVSCGKYEEFHDHFLNYDQIGEFLQKTAKTHRDTVELASIGCSRKGKPIYIVLISSNCNRYATEPALGTFIEAGLNGRDVFAVSNALYIVDYLVNNPSYTRIMHYFIVPCANPDAYDDLIKNKSKKEVKSEVNCGTDKSHNKSSGNRKKSDQQADTSSVDLSSNFPIILGLSDMRVIPTDQFLEKVQSWKLNYVQDSPEVKALLSTIRNYQFMVRLLISLQDGGESICYPHGTHPAASLDVNDLKEVAKKGRCAINGRNFQFGTVYDVRGLTYGSLIDFLKADKSPIKYVYAIQVHKGGNFNEKQELKRLLVYGCQIVECVKRMTTAVYKFYTTMTGNKQVEVASVKDVVNKRNRF